MIIVCAGLYRSGSTWQYNVARLLLPKADWVGYCERDSDINKILKKHKNIIIKCHPYREVLARNADLVLTSHRDLKDVVASSIRLLGIHQGYNLDNLEKYLNGHIMWSYFAHSGDAGIDQNYQDIFNNDMNKIYGTLALICRKREVVINKEIFQVMKELQHLESGKEQGFQDKKTLLWNQHINESKTFSYWKDVLQDHQVNEIEKRFGWWQRMRKFE